MGFFFFLTSFKNVEFFVIVAGKINFLGADHVTGRLHEHGSNFFIECFSLLFLVSFIFLCEAMMFHLTSLHHFITLPRQQGGKMAAAIWSFSTFFNFNLRYMWWKCRDYEITPAPRISHISTRMLPLWKMPPPHNNITRASADCALNYAIIFPGGAV